jgi:hypothetical protein
MGLMLPYNPFITVRVHIANELRQSFSLIRSLSHLGRGVGKKYDVFLAPMAVESITNRENRESGKSDGSGHWQRHHA